MLRPDMRFPDAGILYVIIRKPISRSGAFAFGNAGPVKGFEPSVGEKLRFSVSSRP